MPPIGKNLNPKLVYCKACEGTGRSSGNWVCQPCAGTGIQSKATVGKPK